MLGVENADHAGVFWGVMLMCHGEVASANLGLVSL
jgi:hypothetical protein